MPPIVTSILSGAIPRPGRGKFWLDTFYLFLVVSLQVAVLPSILSLRCVDLVTPWLVYNFIVLSTPAAMIQGFLGALALEGHGSVPGGLYLCSYWIMGLAISMVKKHISWRNLMPWITTVMVSQLWIILFESFVYLVKTSSLDFLSMRKALEMLIRLLITFGMVFVLAGMAPDQPGEEKTV